VCKHRGGHGAITVIHPDGNRLKIPIWMVDSRASEYKLSEQAEISVDALVSLVNLIETLVSAGKLPGHDINAG
jgi:hypothetical protein